jgi:hypothetical protein
VHLYRNDGARSFTQVSSIPFAGTVGQRRAVQVVDIDADGLPEIVLAAADPDQLTILHNDGGGSFSPGTTVAGLMRDFSVADLDGDRRQDLVAGPAGYADVRILQGDQCLW